jgi:endonuclease/exonuclease/phosphatase family metal-dependent hydrolase
VTIAHGVRLAAFRPVVFGFSVALCGCVPSADMAEFTPAPEPCRTAVDASGTTLANAVRWVGPTREDDKKLLGRWCRGVGPVVLYSSPVVQMPNGPPDRLDRALIVVSWNVHIGTADVLGFVDHLKKGHFTGGRPIDRFVLLLQEVNRADNDRVPVEVPDHLGVAPIRAGGRRWDIVTVARTLGLSLVYVPSMRNGRPGDGAVEEDRGNAILSSLPLTSSGVIELPFEGQRRVVATTNASVQDSDGQLRCVRVASAHLDNIAGRIVTRDPISLRLRQARGLLRGLGTLKDLSTGSTITLIVGGDFNTNVGGRHESAIKKMRKEFPSSGFARGKTWGPGNGLFQLDYLFFRLPNGQRATQRRLDGRFGSDHFPLLAEVPIAALVPC